MDKMMWSKPEMNEFAFAANEYVASSCGAQNMVYKFVCDAEKDYGLNLGGSVYVESDKQDGFQENGTNKDDYLGVYHSCGKTHEASVMNKFLLGWFKPFGLVDTEVRKVYIWRGEEENNIHCTTNLDMNSWITAKS